ncbi:lipoate--protein ligase family protein [Candidatus Bathyarchaeota archaeon]|nr:MAG: lipoate--protein ligase family protein [Candidatus Bathyarchaeota archaeon]
MPERRWRLIGLATYNGAMNMAIDEAILMARVEGRVPNTLRFYRWDPSAVSLGMFRPVEEDVDVEACRRLGVDIVRRPTGGGTVYHDREGEITYSVVVDSASLGNPDVPGSYAIICSGLTKALELLGLRAELHPGGPRKCPNIIINGRKVSGNAQVWRKGVILQHGTFLLKVDLARMFTVLRAPWPGSLEEIVRKAEGKITSVERELGRPVSVQEAYEALKEGFSEALGIELEEGELTDYELELARELYETKYAREEWNMAGKAVRAGRFTCLA